MGSRTGSGEWDGIGGRRDGGGGGLLRGHLPSRDVRLLLLVEVRGLLSLCTRHPELMLAAHTMAVLDQFLLCYKQLVL